MAELINAYKPICCNKAYMTKASAIRHEKKCLKNVANRACRSCKHRAVGTETYYNPYHNGDCGSTDFDYNYWWCEIYKMQIDNYSPNIGGMTMLPKLHCKHWESEDTE